VHQPSQIASPQLQNRVSIAGEYASLLDRLVAQFLDWLVLSVAVVILSVPLGLALLPLANPLTYPFQGPAYGIFTSVMGILVPLLYFSYFESSSGQTLGKLVMSIKVVDQTTGARIDFVKALIRNIFRIVDFLPVFYILGGILILATQRKQRLGDLGASSVVVRVHHHATNGGN
jgi:uncharacterized RDD family membrane protein YckC